MSPDVGPAVSPVAPPADEDVWESESGLDVKLSSATTPSTSVAPVLVTVTVQSNDVSQGSSSSPGCP